MSLYSLFICYVGCAEVRSASMVHRQEHTYNIVLLHDALRTLAHPTNYPFGLAPRIGALIGLLCTRGLAT